MSPDFQKNYNLHVICNVADPGSGAFLTSGSGMVFFRIPDPQPIGIFKSLGRFFGQKFNNSLSVGSNFFLYGTCSKIK